MHRLLTWWVPPVIGTAAALALIFWLYRSLDFASFIQELRSAKLGWIAILAATILLEQVINGWKWRQILFDVKPVSTMRLTGALLAGYGANVLVPLGISPLVRSWLIARMENLKMGTVLTTTIIARFIDGIIFALIAAFVAAAGNIPHTEGNLELGLSVAGILNLALFGGLLWALFHFQFLFAEDGPLICRTFDRGAKLLRASGSELRSSLCEGVVWPRDRLRRSSVIVGAVAAKLISATHFVWAGMAVGILLEPFDYLFWVYADSCRLILAFLGSGGRNDAMIFSFRYSSSR